MFVSDKVIYLQLQKSGCNSVAKLINDIAGGKQMQVHSLLRDYSTGKKIAGTIRNPWDWYVSLWSFGCAGHGSLRHYLTSYRKFKPPVRTIKQVAYPPFERTFKKVKFWQNLYSDSNNPNLFQEWMYAIHKPKNKRWLLEEGWLNHPSSDYLGLLSFRYCKFYLKEFLIPSEYKAFKSYDALFGVHDQRFLLDFVIHTETLEEDTLSMLEVLGYDCEKYRKENKEVMINRSKHLSPAMYYDEKTLKLVGKKDRLIIEKYGYEGPSS